MKKLLTIISLSWFAFGATNEELTIAVAKLIQAQNELKQKVTVINKKYITNKYFLSKKDKKKISEAYILSKKNSKLIKNILKKINKKSQNENNVSKISELQEELLALKSNLNKFSKNVSLALQNRNFSTLKVDTKNCKNLYYDPILDQKLLDYLKEK